MKYFLKGVITLALLPIVAVIALIAILLDTIKIFGGCTDYYFLSKLDLTINKWIEK